MKNKKNIKEGFELTDLNADGAISRKEDVEANMLAADFKKYDTYTPGVVGSGTPPNTPDEKADGKLDRWELNAKYPMWQVDGLLKTYGNAGTHLDLLQYAQSQNAKWGATDKCTKAELTTNLPKDIN
jgi:hypothetical protein